ncbi:MAG: acetolactate synthase [Clostridia bacterium]
MIIKQLSVFVENESGRVASIVSSLGKSGIDISALSLADTMDFGIMRMIVDKPEVAMETLKQEGIIYKLTDVLAVALDDQPGGLATVLEVLSTEDYAVNYMYAFMSRSHGAVMVLSVDDTESAMALLMGKGFTSGNIK